MSSLIAAVTTVPPANSSRITPGHDDVVLEVRVHAKPPPDVHLDLVGDVHEAVAGVLVEQPADLDLVAAGDDVAVVVRGADLDAVELAGAHGPRARRTGASTRPAAPARGPLRPLRPG